MNIDVNTIYEETVRVNAFECDFNQKWKPAAFFQHLTEAAVIHAARLGVGYEAMGAKNLFWVHSRMKIQFFKYPAVHDAVTIRTWPKTIQQKLFFIRDFEAVDAAGERLASATSAWLILDAASRRMVPPQSLDLVIPALSERIGLAEPLERLRLEEDGEERLRVRAAYSAVDMVGHVNNSRYVEWICDAFPFEDYQNQKIDWLQINYDKEVRPGEEVSVLVKEQEAGLWGVAGMNRTGVSRAFEALVQWRV